MQLKLPHYIIAAAVLAAGYWYFSDSESATESASYQTKALTTGKIESLVNAAGTLFPVVTVEVGSELSGLVRELNADFNSEVTEGQIIARIDDRTIRARLKQNEADLATANANLLQTKATLNKAYADLKLNHSEHQRQIELREKGLTSQSDLDHAEATFANSEAQVELSKAQVVGAEANIQQSEAQLEQTSLDLERTYIRSPVNGTVIDRQVDVGQTVAASLSAPILFEIAQDLTKMQIEADIDEADIGQITEGLDVRFSVDAFPDRQFSGEVTQVRKASTITSNVVTYKVIISAANPRQELLPGMTANVDLILGEKDNVLRAENSALRFSPPEGVAESTDNNAGGRDISATISTAMEEMSLSSSQKESVLAAVTEMQESFSAARAAGTGGFGAPTGAELITQARTRMTNKLGAVLSAEQLTAISSSLPGGRGTGGGRGNGGGERLQTGEVWVLEDGIPVSKRIRIGLSDDQYTEIQSDELKEGDEVILRLSR